MRIELMIKEADKCLPAGDAAASGQLQHFLFDRFESLLFALQVRKQIGDTVGVQPQAVDLSGKT